MDYKPTLYFPFQMKTRIIFGRGALKEIKTELSEQGIKRIIVVTDKILMENTDFVTRITEILGPVIAGVFNEVEPDTGTDIVEKCAEYFKECNAQGIVSIGGGSVIDTAKGVSACISTGKKIGELVGMGTIKGKSIYHVAIPTTAGTGSEVTSAAVIKDRAQNRKLFLMDINLTPDVAILDPELTLSLPPSLTANTGMDALTHSIEAISSKRRNPISDAMALHSIKLIFKNLIDCVKDGTDIVKRGEMLIAATLAGVSFNFAMVGVVHALAHTVGGLYGIHHGLANAILLVPSMKYNFEKAWKRYALAGECIGLKRNEEENGRTIAQKFIHATEELLTSLGIPTRLREVNVPEEDLEKCAELAMGDPCLITNPRTILSPEELLKILKEAW